MADKQLSNRFLVSIILVCCYQQSSAGVVARGSGVINATTTDKAFNEATKQLKEAHEIKTTTTTVQPELGNTTLTPEFDLEAFVNNQYVANTEQANPFTPPPLYDLLLTESLHTDDYMHDLQDYSNDAPQIKETIDNGDIEKLEKILAKPIFGYEMGQLDDYAEEEEINEYGSESDYMPENCEDTEESLTDKEGGIGHAEAAPLTHEQDHLYSSETNVFEQSNQNKPYESNNYEPQSNSHVHNHNKANESNIYESQTNRNQELSYAHDNMPQHGYGTQPEAYKNHSGGSTKRLKKPKPTSHYKTQNNYEQIIQNEQYQQLPQEIPTNRFVQLSPLEHYRHTNRNPLTNQKPKPQHKQNSNYYITKPQQKPMQNNKPYNRQQIKPSFNQPGQSFNKKPWYNSNYTTITSTPTFFNSSDYNRESMSSSSSNGNFKTWSTTSYLPSSSNSLNPSLIPNFKYGSNNKKKSSPFSTTSGHNQKYRTVSSSTHYVSTPFADLVFKYSIGMAKHSNSKVGNNSAQIFNVQNDINAKPE